MIEINKHPGRRILELGCGNNRHPAADVATDIRFIQGVTDFPCNFEEPLPISSEDFDCVLCLFALEHLSYPKVPAFLREVYRILKAGGKAVFAIPNTQAQTQWIANNPNGWDGKDIATASSELLYGSQTYAENSHKAYFSPEIAVKLFRDAGFSSVLTSPYNERGTDLVVEAMKARFDETQTNILGSNVRSVNNGSHSENVHRNAQDERSPESSVPDQKEGVPLIPDADKSILASAEGKFRRQIGHYLVVSNDQGEFEREVKQAEEMLKSP